MSASTWVRPFLTAALCQRHTVPNDREAIDNSRVNVTDSSELAKPLSYLTRRNASKCNTPTWRFVDKWVRYVQRVLVLIIMTYGQVNEIIRISYRSWSCRWPGWRRCWSSTSSETLAPVVRLARPVSSRCICQQSHAICRHATSWQTDSNIYEIKETGDREPRRF